MRGSRTPALRPLTTDLQNQLRGLSRHRRGKIAQAASTTLVKVDQWARGDALPADLAGAIERALGAGSKAKAKA